ncbi:MAG: type II toxin-antitoxin system VapC family toxin [Candidatus Micrarchaeota archaeon]|nr:type II toxin-antitoxin system VapC family toxin [Candidatus Micrarchaeota archaeon]
MILLDTDVLIEILEKGSELGSKAYEKIKTSGERVCTTAINLHEFLYGVLKYGGSTDDIPNLLILSYTREDAILSSELETRAEETGVKPMKPDAMIAAISINNDCKLLTNNRKDFEKFKGIEFF